MLLLAVAMGADAVGFVFAPSPRQIAPQQVFNITRRLPPEILTVGVFRDELPSRVIETVHRAGLKAAQLHGHESPAMVAEVAEQIRWVIKAVVAGSADARRAKEFGTDFIMVDAAVAGLREAVRLVIDRRGARRSTGDPGRRPGPRQRRHGSAQGAAVGRRCVERSREITRPQGSDEGQGVHRTSPSRCAAATSRARFDAVRLGRRRGVDDVADGRTIGHRTFRRIRRSFRTRDPGAGVRGVGGGVSRGLGRPGVPGRSRPSTPAIRWTTVDPHRVRQPQ